MTYELGENRYGKSRVRLVTVRRRDVEHDLRDLTVDVSLEGDFSAAHVAGDNAKVIATDTMKNTVYALAKEHLTGAPELLGLAIARHFAASAQVGRASVTLREHGWARIETPAGPAPDAFARSGPATRVAWVTVAGRGRSATTSIEAGVEDLTVMKTTKSGFVGFERGEYTTLAETDDRIMATKISATWGYGPGATRSGFDFDAAHARALERLLTTFAEHVSPSVQTSIWIMATAMLDADPAIEWVRMVLPNLHHWTVDLTPFGLENRGEVFVATSEPHGLIDATVHRRS
ncbi:MAG TPA: urate oxidase [Candidatus Limnocylindrales bacterium]|nr:urate oxidase [Candidatus Limnocylindrales bacterium]